MCWSLKKRTFLEFHEVDSPAFLSSGASSTILIRLYNISRRALLFFRWDRFPQLPSPERVGCPTPQPRITPLTWALTYRANHSRPFPFSLLQYSPNLAFSSWSKSSLEKRAKGKDRKALILCNENGYSREIGRRGTPRCCRPSASAPRNPDGNSPPPSADAHLSLRATPRGNTITSVSRMRSPARRITHSWGVAGGSPIQTSWLQSPRAFPRPPASVRSGYSQGSHNSPRAWLSSSSNRPPSLLLRSARSHRLDSRIPNVLSLSSPLGPRNTRGLTPPPAVRRRAWWLIPLHFGRAGLLSDSPRLRVRGEDRGTPGLGVTPARVDKMLT